MLQIPQINPIEPITPPFPNFWILFRGTETNSEFAFSYFLFFLGVMAYTLARIINRKDQSRKASFKAWFEHENNKLEFYLSLIFMYIQVRFSEAYSGWLMNKLPEGFIVVPYFIMVLSGMAQHYIIVQFLKLAKKNQPYNSPPNEH